jgi:hypothetical protein
MELGTMKGSVADTSAKCASMSSASGVLEQTSGLTAARKSAPWSSRGGSRQVRWGVGILSAMDASAAGLVGPALCNRRGDVAWSQVRARIPLTTAVDHSTPRP